MEVLKEIFAFPAYFMIEICGAFGLHSKISAISFFNWFDGYMRYIFGVFIYGMCLFTGSKSIKPEESKQTDEDNK